MVNYQLGKIYKLYCLDKPELLYIGSTAQKTLAMRLRGHRYKYKGYCNGKYAYTTSFKIIETGNYRIELLEAYPCKCKDELLSREGFYIRANPNCVNKCIAGRTKSEYAKQWKEKNPDRVKGIQKAFRERHRNKLNEKHRMWYEENREEQIRKHKEKYSKKFHCDCGSICRLGDKSTHFKTKKHQAWLESQKETNN